MPNVQTVPKHMVLGAKAGFLRAVRDYPQQWQRLAMQHNMDGASMDMVDLGAAPMPVNSATAAVVQQFSERSMAVASKNWNITVHLTYNAQQDDRSQTLERRVRGAGANFARHINTLCFQTLNAGDASTYHLAYDGNQYFDGSHADLDAKYKTAQSNIGTDTLATDPFDAAVAAMGNFMDDQGEYMFLQPDLLVVNQVQLRAASNLTGSPNEYDSANLNSNPHQGMDYIAVPWLDTTAWILCATRGELKPLIVVRRESPGLQSQWFDPTAEDGGAYYFKFYARYDIYYGDWRLAYMGKT